MRTLFCSYKCRLFILISLTFELARQRESKHSSFAVAFRILKGANAQAH